MSNIQTYNSAADIAVVKKQNELTDYMQKSDRWKQFMDKLPVAQQKSIAYDLFVYVNDNADVVKKMDSDDFMKQVIKCYARGLTLRDGDAYILPFSKGGKYDEEGGESDSGAATLVPGYKGVVRLALETGFFTDFCAVPVIVEAIARFDHKREVPIFNEDYIPNGTEKVVGYLGYYKTHTELERQVYKSTQWLKNFAMAKSPSCKKTKKREAGLRGPWADDFDAMCRKTVLKELTKLAPKNSNGNSTYDNFQSVMDMDEDRPDYINADGVVIAPEKLAEVAQKQQLSAPLIKDTPNTEQPSQPTPQAQTTQEDNTTPLEYCKDCEAECIDAVVSYSKKYYGATYCRSCQPKHQKIK